MMVKIGDADGMVAGVKNTTGDVLRPALQIIRTEKAYPQYLYLYNDFTR